MAKGSTGKKTRMLQQPIFWVRAILDVSFLLASDNLELDYEISGHETGREFKSPLWKAAQLFQLTWKLFSGRNQLPTYPKNVKGANWNSIWDILLLFKKDISTFCLPLLSNFNAWSSTSLYPKLVCNMNLNWSFFIKWTSKLIMKQRLRRYNGYLKLKGRRENSYQFNSE